MRFAQYNSIRIPGYATRYSVGLSKQFYHQNVRQGSPDKYLKAFNQLPSGCREIKKRADRFITPPAVRGLIYKSTEHSDSHKYVNRNNNNSDQNKDKAETNQCIM